MHKLNNFGFAKFAIIGIFAILILILTIPLLILLSQQKQTSHNQIQTQSRPEADKPLAVTPTSAATFTFTNEQGTIAGYIYHDNNKNGQREEEEKPFENVKLQMKILKENGDDQTQLETKTDSYGHFNFHFEANSNYSYMVKMVIPKNYDTVDTNPIIISDLKSNTPKIVEFGLITLGETEPSPTPKITLSPKP